MQLSRGATVVLTALTFLSGSQTQAKDPLVGSWELADGKAAVPAPTTFFFKGNGLGASGIGGPPRRMSWHVTGRKANVLTVEVRAAFGRERKFVFRVVDDDHLQWVLPRDLGSVTLRRSATSADEAVPGPDDPAAVAALKKAGVYIEADPEGRCSNVVFTFSVKPEDQNAALAQVAKLPAVRSLNLLYRKGVTDDGIKSLKGLTNLRTLTVGGTNVTDAAMPTLGTLTGLAGLDLKGTKVTDAGLAELSGLKQLYDLGLEGTAVTDKGLARLGPLFGLESINASETSVQGDGLAALKGQPFLAGLYLNNTKLNDAGLAHVKPLTAMRGLFLNDTAVTDAGLANLEGLAELNLLHLRGTKVTDAGVAKLKAALPKCTIIR